MNQSSSNSEFTKDLVNYDFYSQAQATWNVNNLIGDLEKIKKEYSRMGEGLTQFHKQYLLMVLVGKTLKDMIAWQAIYRNLTASFPTFPLQRRPSLTNVSANIIENDFEPFKKQPNNLINSFNASLEDEAFMSIDFIMGKALKS